MGDPLREAHRRAQVSPRDVETRAAYGHALLARGLHAAACHELTVATQARAWGTSRWDRVVAPRPGAPDVRLRVGDVDLRVEVAPFDPKSVAAPDVPDARWPHARLLRAPGDAEWQPLVLVPPPTCAAPGCVEGAVTCPTCGGRGLVTEGAGGPHESRASGGGGHSAVDAQAAEDARADAASEALASGPHRSPGNWPTECHGCDGLGTGACGACDGTGLNPTPRAAPDGCAHEVGVPEWTGPHGWSLSWTLVRCSMCGLAALRHSGEDAVLHWACATCGHPRCVCP